MVVSTRSFEIRGEKIILHKFNELVAIPILLVVYFLAHVLGLISTKETITLSVVIGSLIFIFWIYLYFAVPTKIEVSSKEIGIIYRNRELREDITEMKQVQIKQNFPKKGSEKIMEAILRNREGLNIDQIPTEIILKVNNRDYRVYFGRMSYTRITPIIEFFNKILERDFERQKIKVPSGFTIAWVWRKIADKFHNIAEEVDNGNENLIVN